MFLNNSNCYVKKVVNKNKKQAKRPVGELFQITQNRDCTGLIQDGGIYTDGNDNIRNKRTG